MELVCSSLILGALPSAEPASAMLPQALSSLMEAVLISDEELVRCLVRHANRTRASRAAAKLVLPHTNQACLMPAWPPFSYSYLIVSLHDRARSRKAKRVASSPTRRPCMPKYTPSSNWSRRTSAEVCAALRHRRRRRPRGRPHRRQSRRRRHHPHSRLRRRPRRRHSRRLYRRSLQSFASRGALIRPMLQETLPEVPFSPLLAALRPTSMPGASRDGQTARTRA